MSCMQGWQVTAQMHVHALSTQKWTTRIVNTDRESNTAACIPAVDALEMNKTVLRAEAANRAMFSLWKELSPNCPLLAANYTAATHWYQAYIAPIQHGCRMAVKECNSHACAGQTVCMLDIFHYTQTNAKAMPVDKEYAVRHRQRKLTATQTLSQ